MSTLIHALTKPSVTNDPPSAADLRITEIAVLVTLAFALFLGMGIRNNVLSNSRAVTLGEDLPEMRVPAGWISRQVEDTVYAARNPRNASIFDSAVQVAVRPMQEGDTPVTVRSGLSVQRSRNLARYRELGAQRVTVGGAPGLLVTYAYVADPTRDQGAVAPPVVVQAQDLFFAAGDQMVIVTVAADAADWDEEESYFRVIFDSLNVEEAGQ